MHAQLRSLRKLFRFILLSRHPDHMPSRAQKKTQHMTFADKKRFYCRSMDHRPSASFNRCAWSHHSVAHHSAFLAFRLLIGSCILRPFAAIPLPVWHFRAREAVGSSHHGSAAIFGFSVWRVFSVLLCLVLFCCSVSFWFVLVIFDSVGSVSFPYSVQPSHRRFSMSPISSIVQMKATRALTTACWEKKTWPSQTCLCATWYRLEKTIHVGSSGPFIVWFCCCFSFVWWGFLWISICELDLSFSPHVALPTAF